MTVRAYIGIGSNLNDPVVQVQEALGELEMLPDTILVSKSSLCLLYTSPSPRDL